MKIDSSRSYLLDTGVWIEIRRGNANIRKFLFNARFHGQSVGYSILTEAELWVGISASKFRTEKEHTDMLRPFKRYMMTVSIARRGGELKRLLKEKGSIPLGQRPFLDDCLIMATAEYYDLVLITLDKADFSKFARHDLVKSQIQFLTR